jgi:hypothetical protein
MIGLEMQNTKAQAFPATQPTHDRFERSSAPSDVERRFACQLATSVWLRQLGDEDARQALSAYVKARGHNRRTQVCLSAALEDEYRLCRERLDLCS